MVTKTSRGAATVMALVVTAIVVTLLAASAVIASSHYSRARMESDYATALYLAEAGVNFELRKISDDTTAADQKSDDNPNGVSYNYGGGSYSVYCIGQDGTYPWVAPAPLYIVSTGTFNGLSRTIRVEGERSGGGDSEYALYGISRLRINGAININGSAGTNGLAHFTGAGNITNGTLDINGPDASSNMSGAFNIQIVYNPSPVLWQTVDEIANSRFPGGLAYLKTNNDNSLCPSLIQNNAINFSGAGNFTIPSKPGGANYYIESARFTGAGNLKLDNSKGPITFWVGPSGGSGNVNLAGALNITKSISNYNRVRFYMGTRGSFTMDGAWNTHIGVYAYNRDTSTGAEYGSIIVKGAQNIIKGSVIGYDVDFKTAANIIQQNKAEQWFPHQLNRYGFKRNYSEINRPQ